MQSPINAPLPKLHGLDLKSMILTALQEIKQVCSILDDQIALWSSLRQVAFELGMRFYAFQDFHIFHPDQTLARKILNLSTLPVLLVQEKRYRRWQWRALLQYA